VGAYANAVALWRAGDEGGAVRGFEQALADPAESVAAHAALGLVHGKAGRLFLAEEHLRASLAGGVDGDAARGESADGVVATNLAAVLHEQGRPAEACAVLYPHLQGGEDCPLGWHPVGWNTLGVSLLAQGLVAEAAGCFQRAHQQDSSNPLPLVHLHGALFDDQDTTLARRALEAAAAVAPTDPATRFHLGVIWGLLSPDAAKRHHAVLPPAAAPWQSSWAFFLENRDKETRVFGCTASTLRFAAALAHVQGLVLEFGVRFGTSLRVLQAAVDQTVHGFDTFTGLPEDWHTMPKGAYSTGGRVPELGPTMPLHPGLFADTLPGFLDAHPGPARLVHVDCDLYGATLDALRPLAERVGPGTVLVFDEYLMNPHWREDEHRAFTEVAAALGWRFRYAAVSFVTNQAVVEIL
jgi:Tfp pilus assembly protein PilF